jgi:hypothetical protein
MKNYIFLLLILVSSCASRYIKYDRHKLIKKYSSKYKTFVDKKEVNLKNTYLDKNNIKNVYIDKHKKKLIINQFKPVALMELKNLKLDSLITGNKLKKNTKIQLILIDGVPLSEHMIKKTKIDIHAIKSINLINFETSCKDGEILLITTKDKQVK